VNRSALRQKTVTVYWPGHKYLHSVCKESDVSEFCPVADSPKVPRVVTHIILSNHKEIGVCDSTN